MSTGNARYGLVSIVLHWTMAALIAVQFVVGFVMPDINRKTQVESWISLHLSLGALIVLLVIIRIGWRISHPVPKLLSLPRWQRLAAHATHSLLYVLLFVAPVLGWGNASARGWEVDLFGLFMLPPLTDKGSAIGGAMGDLHVVTVYVMLALIGVHILAALYHHFVQRDQVLQQMLPNYQTSQHAHPSA